MAARPVRVAIIGAGTGGPTAAAAVLSRCLDGIGRDGNAAALQRHARTGPERTATIQRTSPRNTWLTRNTWLKGNTNADWVPWL